MAPIKGSRSVSAVSLAHVRLGREQTRPAQNITAFISFQVNYLSKVEVKDHSKAVLSFTPQCIHYLHNQQVKNGVCTLDLLYYIRSHLFACPFLWLLSLNIKSQCLIMFPSPSLYLLLLHDAPQIVLHVASALDIYCILPPG